MSNYCQWRFLQSYILTLSAAMCHYSKYFLDFKSLRRKHLFMPCLYSDISFRRNACLSLVAFTSDQCFRKNPWKMQDNARFRDDLQGCNWNWSKSNGPQNNHFCHVRAIPNRFDGIVHVEASKYWGTLCVTCHQHRTRHFQKEPPTTNCLFGKLKSRKHPSGTFKRHEHY